MPGPLCAELGEIAADHGVHLVVGVVERSGSTLYCAVLTFGPDGSLLARRRKLMPTAAERLVWGCGDGSTLGVVATPIGRIGSVICWEGDRHDPRRKLHRRPARRNPRRSCLRRPRGARR